MDNEGAQVKYQTRRPGCEFYGHQRRKVSLVTEKGKKKSPGHIAWAELRLTKRTGTGILIFSYR